MPITALSASPTFNALKTRVTAAEVDIVDLQNAAAGEITAGDTIVIAANTNNLSIGAAEVIPLSNTTGASKNITGIAGGAAGKVKRLVGVGSSTILLSGESAASTAGNRFASGASLAAGQVLTIIYNGTSARWEVFA